MGLEETRGDVCITKVRVLRTAESSGGFDPSIGKAKLGYLFYKRLDMLYETFSRTFFMLPFCRASRARYCCSEMSGHTIFSSIHSQKLRS